MQKISQITLIVNEIITNTKIIVMKTTHITQKVIKLVMIIDKIDLETVKIMVDMIIVKEKIDLKIAKVKIDLIIIVKMEIIDLTIKIETVKDHLIEIIMADH